MDSKILAYFQDKVSEVLNSLSIDVDISIDDYDDTCYEVGRCYKFDDGSYKITVDSFFVECNYKHDVAGCRWALDLVEDESLLRCLCHEIAHMRYWNHTKWHKRLTEDLMEKVLGSRREIQILGV